jgi:hypothetical protein
MKTVRVRHFLCGKTRTMEVSLDRGQPFDLHDLAFFTWPDNAADRYPYRLLTGDSSLSPWMREISFRDDALLAHLFLDVLPYALEIDGELSAHPESPVSDLLAIVLSPVPSVGTYRQALRRGPSRNYVDRVLRQLETDCHTLPADDVLGLLDIAAARWSGPGRLERILRRLDGRPDVDPHHFQGLSAVISERAQETPGLRRVLEFEAAPHAPAQR